MKTTGQAVPVGRPGRVGGHRRPGRDAEPGRPVGAQRLHLQPLIKENLCRISSRSTTCPIPPWNVFARLTQAQLRSRLEPEKGVFIAESPKVIARALDAGLLPLSLLMERRKIEGPARRSWPRCPADTPVYTADRDILTALTGYQLNRGVLAAFTVPPCPAWKFCAGTPAGWRCWKTSWIPPTSGPIFRSAAALHIDAVLVTPSCCDPLCRRAVRVSMGTVFQCPGPESAMSPPTGPLPA